MFLLFIFNMEANFFLIIIFILQFLFISSNYSFELIEELVPKKVIFDMIDFNSFKIFKYIPTCIENSKFNKSVYAETFTDYFAKDIYLYDDFNNIRQDQRAKFINYLDFREERKGVDSSVELFNLTCDKEYFFVLSFAQSDIYVSRTYSLFSIIDLSNDKINISPLISEYFIFDIRKPIEIFEYFHNETKYAILSFNDNAEVKILKNKETIYYHKKGENAFIEPIEFEKNQNYTIYFEGNIDPLIKIQFFNEPKFFKIDLKNAPIPLFKSKYYFEFDISDYQINDTILFNMYSRGNYRFSYQYNKNFKRNNFIDIGNYKSSNYIPIIKTINDTSIIIFIEFHRLEYSFLDLIKNVEKIDSEFKKEIIGPKYYYIDNFELNNINSIGIEANEKFLIYEQANRAEINGKYEFKNLYITTTTNNHPDTFNKLIIIFNSKNKILFEIKKFNYQIFWNKYSTIKDEFFNLCQDEKSLNELYFYVNELELFLSVFGSFDSYFIIEENIKYLSDLDFGKIKEPNFYQVKKDKGYLKIKCKEPLMLKHFNCPLDWDLKLLNSNRKYYLGNYDLREKNYTFDSNLINNDLNIKITIYGLEPRQSIQLILNNNTYIYTISNNSHYFSFKYEKYLPDIFHFKLDEEYNNSFIGEVIVGILQKNINKTLKQIDFEEIYGSLTLLEGESVAIKVPYNFTKDLYNFSLIFPNNYFMFYADISYDKLEFQTKNKQGASKISPIIPLFQVDPYKYIPQNLVISKDKFFYIFIYNGDYIGNTIYIKKPMVSPDIKFNKINVLPKLSEDNAIYYYQLKIPEPQNNNYIAIQNYPFNKMSFSRNNIQYPYLALYYDYTYYNILYDKRKKNNDEYINFYDIQENPGYINFIETNEHIYPDNNPLLKINLNVTQVEGENKLRIKLNSLSYIFYPNLVKYYFITNIENSFYEEFSMITGNQKPDKSKYQFITVVEDDGENELIEKDIKIDIDLKDDCLNDIYCIPVNNKTNIIEKNYIEYKIFYYKNIKSSENHHNYSALIIVISIVILIIILIIFRFFYFKGYKRSNEDIEKDALNAQFNEI